jgi:hypothetical protein
VAAATNAAIGNEYLGMDPFARRDRAPAFRIRPGAGVERRPGRARNLRLLQPLSYRDVRTVGVGRIPQLALDMQTCEEDWRRR